MADETQFVVFHIPRNGQLSSRREGQRLERRQRVHHDHVDGSKRKLATREHNEGWTNHLDGERELNASRCRSSSYLSPVAPRLCVDPAMLSIPTNAVHRRTRHVVIDSYSSFCNKKRVAFLIVRCRYLHDVRRSSKPYARISGVCLSPYVLGYEIIREENRHVHRSLT